MSRFSGPITKRRMAPAFAITFTLSIWPMLISLHARRLAVPFTISKLAAVRVCEVIESCRKITGQPIPVLEKPRRAGDPPRLIASSEKIKRELGWRPQFQTLDAIVDSAWKWHQKFPRGYED